MITLQSGEAHALTVPADIPNDCSRDVEGALNDFFASVPDGTTVEFPANGCYAHGNAIQVRDKRNVTIDGRGSTFRSSAPNTGRRNNPNWLLLRGRNLTLKNLTAVGNFNLAGPRSPGRVSCDPVEPSCNAFNAGVSIYGGDGIYVTDVRAERVFGDGLFAGASEYVDLNPPYEIPRNVHVTRFQATTTARHCFAPTEAVGFWLEDSKGTDCWYGGFDAEKESRFPLHDIHILRNTFEGFFVFGIAFPVALPAPGDVRDIEIRDNRFLTTADNVCNPVIIVGAYPTNPNNFSNVVVENNELVTSGTPMHFDHVRGGSVRNNKITQMPTGTTPASYCSVSGEISVTNSTDVVVAGNGPTAAGPAANVGLTPVDCWAPTSLRVTSTASTTVSLAWDAVPGASSYEVLYAQAPVYPWSVYEASIRVTNSTLRFLWPGQAYNFAVRALCGENVSGASNVVSAVPV